MESLLVDYKNNIDNSNNHTTTTTTTITTTNNNTLKNYTIQCVK